MHWLYSHLVNHPIHLYPSISVDETTTDTNNFASSFWVLLNGRRVNTAELFYGVWALFCSPPLKIFCSVFNRKILKMLHWCYLTLGIIVTCVLRNVLIPISTQLDITQASWNQQKKLFWPPTPSETSSRSPAQKASALTHFAKRLTAILISYEEVEDWLSSHLAVPSAVSLTVPSFNSGNIKSNYFQLPIRVHIQYSMYIVYVIWYPMYTYIHPINTG